MNFLRCILTLACACIATAAAVAQDLELEQVVVTGSRIAHRDFESASPIVTIPEDRFQQYGSVSVESTLSSMPQFVGAAGGTTNYSGGDGQAKVSLRGLRPTETLVLVDGRRLIPANGNGVPDLNLIPPSLVERVEVLTGGASAVYGSDAMAGVVNFKLRQRYDGVEFAGDWGQTDRGDGESYTAGITGGMDLAGDRGSLMANVSYARRDQVNWSDRKFSRVVLGYYGPGTDGVGPGGEFLPEGSSFIEEGRATLQPSTEAFNALFARYGSPSGTVPYQDQFGFNSDGTVFTRGNGEPGSVVNFRGRKDPLTFNDRLYTYNYAPANALQLPLERTSAFLNARFEINDEVELYAQGIYGDFTVNTQQAPTPVPRVYMPPTNPYISPDLKFLLDSRTDPDAPVSFSKRTLELGPRVYENNYDTYQVTVGLLGKVLAGWHYNAYVQYGQSDQMRVSSANVSVSRFEELLYAPDGGKSICGGLNPFGLDSISAECAQYMAVDLRDTTVVQQLTAEVSLGGSPFELPAGGLETVFGLFYKEDRYSQRPDPAAGVFLPDGRTDIAGYLTGATRMDGADHNLDAYVESMVPLLVDKPGVRRLQTVLGYRYSDYASAGGTSSYKAELLYEPIDPVHIRGSFQHAVRAPSVFELYDPQLTGLPWIGRPDPCSVGSEQRTGPDGAAVEALCLAQGIPADLLPSFNYQDELVEGFLGGNPDLKPEKARTYTVGVVLSSPFGSVPLKSFQISLDWYEIHITDAIGTVGAASFIPHCYDPKFNPTFDVANRSCSYFSRDPTTGVIVDAYEITRNIAGVDVSGVDVEIDWRMDIGPGELGLTWLLAWVDSWVAQFEPEVKGEQWAGTDCGATLPEWKWNLDARYHVGGLTLGAIWRHLGQFRDCMAVDFEVPATDYLDLTIVHEFKEGWSDGLTLRAGITNVTDQMPPIYPYYIDANTDPAVFDVLGRSYFVGLTYAFGRRNH